MSFRISKQDHDAYVASLNKEQADLEKALATSAAEHAKLLAAKQAQEMLLVEHLTNLQITPSSGSGTGLLSKHVGDQVEDTMEETCVEHQDNLISFDEEAEDAPLVPHTPPSPPTKETFDLPPLREELVARCHQPKYSDYSHLGAEGLQAVNVVCLYNCCNSVRFITIIYYLHI